MSIVIYFSNKDFLKIGDLYLTYLGIQCPSQPRKHNLQLLMSLTM